MYKKPRTRTVLAAWMKERDVSANALARATGVPQPTISRILTGESKDPETGTLEPLAIYFGRTVAELRGEVVNNSATAPYVGRSPTDSGMQPARLVPLLSWEEAKKYGGGTVRAPPDVERYPCPVDCSKDTFALRVEGVSMEPKFHAGEIVFVDPRAAPRHDCFVVAIVERDGIPKLKRYLLESGQAYLHSLNPQWQEPIIKIDEHVIICGVVVFKGERL